MAHRRVLCGCLVLLFLGGCQQTAQDPKERFRTLMKTGFKAPDQEISEVFHDCFREGALVGPYQDLLATAHQRYENRGKSETYYEWATMKGIDPGEEGDISRLTIVTYGEPAHIKHVWISTLWKD